MKSLRSKLTVVLAFFALIAISFGFMLMPSIASAKTVDTSTGFYAHDGAEIRVEDDGTGIKWTATMTAATYKKLQDDAGANITEIGISIIPSAINGVASAESYRKYYPYGGEENPTLPRYAEDDEGVPTLNGSATFTYSWAVFYDQLVEELGTEDLNDAYALNLEVKPYVVINGETVFGESYNTSRSMRSIATYWILSGKYDNDEVRLAKLKSFLPYELVPADTEYRAEGCYYSNHDGEGAITIADDIKSVMSGAKVYYGAKDITELYDADAGVVNLTGVETQITTDGLTNDYLTIIDAQGVVYKQYFVGVTLAIDELSDFMDYFKISSVKTSDGIDATIPEGEGEWDGYYIMLADIEGAGCEYNATISHDVGNFSAINPAKVDAALANGTTNGIMTNGKPIKGLTGTFDGNGHQIKNLRTIYGGLFGMVLGGTVKNLFINKTGYVSDSVIAHAIAGGATIENVQVVNDRANVYANYSMIAKSIGDATIKNVFLESTRANVDWGYSQSYSGYPGSFGTITADTKVEDAIIISKVEGAGTITSTSWTPNTDAEYVDGVLNETADIDIIQGARRYSSTDAFNSDKANLDFSSWDPDVWAIIDNTPIFRTTLDSAEYGAYIGDVNASESTVTIVEENSATVTIKYGYNTISIKPVLSIVSGEDFVSIEDNVITALAEGDAVVKATYGKYEWNVSVSVMAAAADIIDIETEYHFSVHDGQFYDDSFNVVSIATILGVDTVELETALDENNNILTYNEETGAITGIDLGKQSTWKETSIILSTADASYRVNILAADAILKEKEDLDVLTFQGDATLTSSSFVYTGEDDFIWDGYYVVVNDIDASGYTFIASANATFTARTGISIENFASTNYGFSGVFDGQGYTIDKLMLQSFGVEGTSTQNGLGLFSYLNGGTIKDVAFTNLASRNGKVNNCPDVTCCLGDTGMLTHYMVNGAKMENIYLHSSTVLQGSRARYLFWQADSSSSLSNIVVNVTSTGTNANGYGLWNESSAQLSDFICVADFSVSVDARVNNATAYVEEIETGTQTTVKWQKVAIDAEYLNGEQNTTSTADFVYHDSKVNIVYSFDEYKVATSSTATASNDPYAITVVSGMRRYTSDFDWTQETLDFSSWNTEIWNTNTGSFPVFN